MQGLVALGSAGCLSLACGRPWQGSDCIFCMSPKTNLCPKIRGTQGKGVMPDGTSRFTLKKVPLRLRHSFREQAKGFKTFRRRRSFYVTVGPDRMAQLCTTSWAAPRGSDVHAAPRAYARLGAEGLPNTRCSQKSLVRRSIPRQTWRRLLAGHKS